MVFARWATSPMFSTWATMFSIRTVRSVRPFKWRQGVDQRLELSEGLIGHRLMNRWDLHCYSNAMDATGVLLVRSASALVHLAHLRHVGCMAAATVHALRARSCRQWSLARSGTSVLRCKQSGQCWLRGLDSSLAMRVLRCAQGGSQSGQGHGDRRCVEWQFGCFSVWKELRSCTVPRTPRWRAQAQVQLVQMVASLLLSCRQRRCFFYDRCAHEVVQVLSMQNDVLASNLESRAAERRWRNRLRFGRIGSPRCDRYWDRNLLDLSGVRPRVSDSGLHLW